MKNVIISIIVIMVLGGGIYLAGSKEVSGTGPGDTIKLFLEEANESIAKLEVATNKYYSRKALATLDEIRNKSTTRGKLASGFLGGIEGVFKNSWELYTKSGIIESTKILNEDIDGSVATVRFEITYEDGNNKVDDWSLVKEESVWKIDKQLK